MVGPLYTAVVPPRLGHFRIIQYRTLITRLHAQQLQAKTRFIKDQTTPSYFPDLDFKTKKKEISHVIVFRNDIYSDLIW